jgi:RNA polymerase sigma-70 factor (ECF subfamily)
MARRQAKHCPKQAQRNEATGTTKQATLLVTFATPTFPPQEIADCSDLLQEAMAGDSEAFGELCRSYETRLLRQALTLCGNAALAEDLAQDTLVEAWKCLRRYNGRCRFFTWLCAILLNRYRNTRRQNRTISWTNYASTELDKPGFPFDQISDCKPHPDQVAERQEQAALVWQCVKSLPPKHQQVIYLRFYVDNSLEGIAAALGCSIGTVKSRLFHALEKLRGMRVLHSQLTTPEINTDKL